MSIVTLDDVYDTLNIKDPDGTDDGELQGFIDGAQAVIESIVGPVEATAFTDEFITDTTNPWPYHYGTWPRYTYGVRSVVLRHQPVLSVTSVTVSSMDGSNASVMSSGSYRFDTPAAMVTVIDSSAFGPKVTVSYTAGRATVPANVRLAALELIRVQWQPQQSGNLPGVGTDEFGGTSVLGYFVPNRVRELLQPQQLGPVIA